MHEEGDSRVSSRPSVNHHEGDSEKRLQPVQMLSAETIYQYIWWDKAHGGELYKHLRHRGRRHKKRGALRKRRGTIPNRIDISERPKIVDRKNRVGDYEVDTIVGAARSQHILTLNDRKTGKVWLRKLETRASLKSNKCGLLLCKTIPFLGA